VKERGYYGIGVINPKFDENLGSLWRSANVFNASFIYTVERKYKRSRYADTMNTPKHIPLYEYDDFETFYTNIPEGCVLIAVENSENSQLLTEFTHPERCIYLLGSESKGIPEEILKKCERIVRIPGRTSINVSIAGSIIMYDRLAKGNHEVNNDLEGSNNLSPKKIAFERCFEIGEKNVCCEISVNSSSLKVKLVNLFEGFEAVVQSLPHFSISQKKYFENGELSNHGIEKSELLAAKLIELGKKVDASSVSCRNIINDYYLKIDQINNDSNYLNNINFTKARNELKKRLEKNEIGQNEYQNKYLRELSIKHQDYLKLMNNTHGLYNKKLGAELNFDFSGIDIIKCLKKYFNID
jgi:tRNA(Leu) C34 or U34 (ribose-2'-O)-methylase TrmL